LFPVVIYFFAFNQLFQVCLIWVGRLVPEKRPDIWRDVYLALLAEGFPVKGLVVGVGPCQVMFDACPGVTVAGWLNGVDLAEAYASADLLLFPSDVETFGNVTLEALGSGIPAVVSRRIYIFIEL
jgi:glycosyltransferase involved in cell wall biosynthesis